MTGDANSLVGLKVRLLEPHHQAGSIGTIVRIEETLSGPCAVVRLHEPVDRVDECLALSPNDFVVMATQV